MTKWVYTFGGGRAEGRASDYERLGGKGANLAEMCTLGLPVPPGLTIVADACDNYYKNGRKLPEALKGEVAAGLSQMEAITGRRFGDTAKPLLISVRSGARVSMPGMMDTVLNLGLNDQTVQALGHDAGDARFAWDSYRRFIQMYADVVMGLDHEVFEEILEDEKAHLGHALDTDLSAVEWQHVVSRYKAVIEEELGEAFPQDPEVQLWRAVGAVFASWMSARAVTYRLLHNIPEAWGTAVNIQAMVFGNLGNTSATGVAFTRNPSSGENELYGEFLVNAQGEDVVAGIRTPQSITEAGRIASGLERPSMEKLMPEAFAEFRRICSAARSALPRYAGSRIHRRTRHALDAADALGQAHHQGGAEIAVDMVADGADHRGRGGVAHRSGLARPVAASDDRSARPPRGDRLWPAGLAGCGDRGDRLYRRGGGGSRGRRVARSFWCASRPARRIFTACTPPKAS